jgi:hypothetical protein
MRTSFCAVVIFAALGASVGADTLTVGPTGTIVCDSLDGLKVQLEAMTRSSEIKYVDGCRYLPKGGVTLLSRQGRFLHVALQRPAEVPSKLWSTTDGFVESYRW